MFLQTSSEYEGNGLATLLLDELWQKAIAQKKSLSLKAVGVVEEGMSFYKNWYAKKVCPNEEYRRLANKRFYTFETTATFSELCLPYEELKKFSISTEELERYWENLADDDSSPQSTI